MSSTTLANATPAGDCGRRTAGLFAPLASWAARRVRERLLELGFPADRTIAIPNGIRLEPFAGADAMDFSQRTPGIVTSRASRARKTMPRWPRRGAAAGNGLAPPVLLAGGGKARYRCEAEALCHELGLQEQVRFLGFCDHVPRLLMTHQVCVLSTTTRACRLARRGHGGRCVVGSAVTGVKEVLNDGINGRLVPHADPAALAGALEGLLRDPALAARLGAAARATALDRHSLELMTQRYEDLFVALAAGTRAADEPNTTPIPAFTHS